MSKASTSRASSVACLLPPTQVGVLVSWIAAGGPGVMVMAFEVAGALPASSCATIDDRLRERVGLADRALALEELELRW